MAMIDLPAGTRRTASPRLTRLQEDFIRRQRAAAARSGSRLYYLAEEREAFSRAVLRAYRETAGQPAILRRARVLERFAEEAVITLSPDDLLAGSQKFCAFGFAPEDEAEIAALGYARNAGHIVHDYAALTRWGVAGLAARLQARQAAATAAERVTLTGFARALQAFARFIARHAGAADALASTRAGAEAQEWRERAADLRRLCQDPPASFRQALQLTWFAQIFLHAENPSAAISFGRLDQYLWPFLAADLAAGRSTLAEAGELVGAFCLRCGEGEESQNLTIGGIDAAGADATNPLSLLLLQMVRELRAVQPSLCVRIHAGTPPELWQAACRLAAAGTGQPGFINDAAAIPALGELDIPSERARDYAIVGCYEATTQGDCYPNTVAGSVPCLARALVDFLATPAAAATDFPAFLDAYLRHVETVYTEALNGRYRQAWEHWRDGAPSPFGSLLLAGCLDRALPLESGGARFNLFGINLLGFGTTVDSLHAIANLVFGTRELSLTELQAALANDFADQALRGRLRSLPGRYGTDSEASNRLAAELSDRLATLVLSSRLPHGVRPYPGLFRWTGDIWDHAYATPDGRRAAETLSYGCGPASDCGGTPTSILASVAHLAHRRCACGNPLALALPARDARGPEGLTRLQALVQGYFARGGFHLHFNLLSPQALRAAQAAPEQHQDLTIRISGLSARFVALPEPIQAALVERAERGV